MGVSPADVVIEPGTAVCLVDGERCYLPIEGLVMTVVVGKRCLYRGGASVDGEDDKGFLGPRRRLTPNDGSLDNGGRRMERELRYVSRNCCACRSSVRIHKVQ
jgi:hypothetical protein